MFRDILKAIKVEIKNVILQSAFHLVRFGGLLIIPFIYGFSYIFAFYDPFENVNQLPVSVITENQKDDAFGFALGEALKKSKIKIGDLEMDISMEHIYNKEQTEEDKIKKDSFATIKVESLNNVIVNGLLKHFKSNNGNDDALTIQDIMNIIDTDIPHIEISPNYKKNYLIAFGVDIGTAMQGTYQAAINKSIQALESTLFLDQVSQENGDAIFEPSQKILIKEFVDKLKETLPDENNPEEFNLEILNPVKLNTNMAEHAKYGFGLAPFFISVAMWVGGMVMTFAVHRKIYDTSVTPGHRYFAKWLLIIFGTFFQATILMLSLYIIGFKQLGIDHWGSMYGFAIIIGIIFASIIQSIRFIIYSRNVGILLTIILLVLQMASGGGLFPIETQSGFYQTLNIILPMSKSINIIRETSFDTDWNLLFTQLGYLLIYLLAVPIGVVINHWRTLSWYTEHNIELPAKILKRINYRNQKNLKKSKKKNISTKHLSKKDGG